ncbi:MAG: hypothetical protein ACFFFB_15335, partial [Candidatus Heimdallarchaeota archaeon]
IFFKLKFRGSSKFGIFYLDNIYNSIIINSLIQNEVMVRMDNDCIGKSDTQKKEQTSLGKF